MLKLTQKELHQKYKRRLIIDNQLYLLTVLLLKNCVIQLFYSILKRKFFHLQMQTMFYETIVSLVSTQRFFPILILLTNFQKHAKTNLPKAKPTP